MMKVVFSGLAKKELDDATNFYEIEFEGLGLYLLAFACELRRFQVPLKRMFGASGVGVPDQLIRYSKPVTSSCWFAPSREALMQACSPDTEI